MNTHIKNTEVKGKYPYFPYLLPKETPYSLVSRYVTITREYSRNISVELFNTKRVISTSLNGRIALFCERTGLRGDPKKILMENTLLPLYLLNFSSHDKDEIINELINGDQRKALRDIGYRRSPIMICPQCKFEDTMMYGIPYLRREHQIPGIYYCANHKVKLKELITGNDSYANLYYCQKKDISIAGEEALYLKLARISNELLNYKFDKDQIDLYIKNQLIYHGYKIGPRLYLNKTSKLQNDFLSFYGIDILNQIGLGGFELRLNWLERLLTRLKDVNIKPIAYIAFISYFSDSLGEFIDVQVDEPKQVKMRKPKPENIISNKRKVLNALIERGLTRTELKEHHSALYRHFLRYDRTYLDEKAPAKIIKGHGKKNNSTWQTH